MSTPVAKLGDSGVVVRGLQDALDAANFSPGTIDGVFGPRTEAAVRRFQRAIGAVSNGLIDAVTAAHLQRRRPADAPPLLRRNPANPYQRHLLPDDQPPRRRGRSR